MKNVSVLRLNVNILKSTVYDLSGVLNARLGIVNNFCTLKRKTKSRVENPCKHPINNNL